MSNLVTTQAEKLGVMFGMDGDGKELVEILKSTAFKGQVSDAQMAALMVVANQYGLNPFTKELYAFPDKNNGIVPVVGVDGWARIINTNQQFDGMEFEQDDEACTCIIYRKDRTRAIKVTEYMSECRRGTAPWQSHPKRMLRHKAMIQCARLAFGYVGIYDEDEAERIKERDMGFVNRETGEVTPAPRAELPPYADEAIDANLGAWKGVVDSGRKTADSLIATLKTKAVLSPAQEQRIRDGLTEQAPIDAEFAAEYEGAEQ